VLNLSTRFGHLKSPLLLANRTADADSK